MPLVKKKSRILITRTCTHTLKNSLPNWKSLSSKFTVKTPYIRLISLEAWSSSPYGPKMNVSSSLQSIVTDSIDGRWGNIGDIRTFILNDFGDQYFKESMVIVFVSLLAPTPIIYSLQDLIISRPQSKSWIISGSSDLFLDLLFSVHQEFFRRWIDTIAKHEVVEKHNSFSWCQLKEFIRFILTPSPNPNHVEIRVNSSINQFLYSVSGFKTIISQSWIEHVWRHIVSTLTVDWIAIYFHLKLLVFQV